MRGVCSRAGNRLFGYVENDGFRRVEKVKEGGGRGGGFNRVENVEYVEWGRAPSNGRGRSPLRLVHAAAGEMGQLGRVGQVGQVGCALSTFSTRLITPHGNGRVRVPSPGVGVSGVFRDGGALSGGGCRAFPS